MLFFASFHVLNQNEIENQLIHVPLEITFVRLVIGRTSRTSLELLSRLAAYESPSLVATSDVLKSAITSLVSMAISLSSMGLRLKVTWDTSIG